MNAAESLASIAPLSILIAARSGAPWRVRKLRAARRRLPLTSVHRLDKATDACSNIEETKACEGKDMRYVIAAVMTGVMISYPAAAQPDYCAQFGNSIPPGSLYRSNVRPPQPARLTSSIN